MLRGLLAQVLALAPHIHRLPEIPFSTFVSKQFICINWPSILPSVPPGRQPSSGTHTPLPLSLLHAVIRTRPPPLWYVAMARATRHRPAVSRQSNPLFAAFLLRHLRCDFCHFAFVRAERCFAYQLMPVNIAYCFVILCVHCSCVSINVFSASSKQLWFVVSFCFV